MFYVVYFLYKLIFNYFEKESRIVLARYILLYPFNIPVALQLYMYYV